MSSEKPDVFWRLIAWCSFVSVSAALAYWMFADPSTTPDDRITGGFCFLPFVCVAIYAVVITHEVYRWNDEEICRRLLLRETSIRWDKVVSVYVLREGRDWAYVLRDSQGRKLRVDVGLLIQESPLRRVLRDKLSHLSRWRESEGGAREGTFTLRILGVHVSSFTTRRNSLIYRCRGKTREILLDQVREVYESRDGILVSDASDLAVKHGVTLRIPSRTKGYENLIVHIKERAKSAFWVDLDRPEPGAGPERTPYLRGKIRLIAQRKRALWILLGVVTAPLAGIGLWDIARNGLRDAGGILVGLAMIYVLPCNLIMMAIRDNRRSLKELRKRLSLIEADGEKK